MVLQTVTIRHGLMRALVRIGFGKLETRMDGVFRRTVKVRVAPVNR